MNKMWNLNMRLMHSLSHDALKDACAELCETANQFEDEVKELKKINEKTVTKDCCTWFLDDHDGSYDADCGNKFQFIDGNPKENGFKFCPFCGGGIYKKHLNIQTGEYS